MPITAYVQTGGEHPGRLAADSTITVDGVTYPIPERGWYGRDRKPSRAAPHRIAAALESAGYDPRYSDAGGPDSDGVFEIRVVKG